MIQGGIECYQTLDRGLGGNDNSLIKALKACMFTGTHQQLY